MFNPNKKIKTVVLAGIALGTMSLGSGWCAEPNDIPDTHLASATTESSPAGPFALQVKGERINLRSGPGQKYPIITQVSAPEHLIVCGRDGEWVKIQWPGLIPVWINKSYVKESQPGYGVVAGRNVNFRLKPGLEHPIVAQYSDGAELTIVGTKDEWVAVKPLPDLYCWIYADYLGSEVMPIDRYFEFEHLRQAETLYQSLSKQYEKYLVGADKETSLEELKAGFLNISKSYPSTDWAKLSEEKSKDISNRMKVKKEASAVNPVREHRPLAIADGSTVLPYQNTGLNRRQESVPSSNGVKNTVLAQVSENRNKDALSVKQNFPNVPVAAHEAGEKKSETLSVEKYRGIIKDVGVVRGRLSNFKLMSENGKTYYLTSKSVNFADYPYGSVEVSGALQTPIEGKARLLDVIDIKWAK